MAIGSSNIIIRDIFNEINSTTHNSSATIADCDLDALARLSVGTRAGGAAWGSGSPAYSSLVMDDWAGYVHTLEFAASGSLGPLIFANTNVDDSHGDIVSYVRIKRSGNEPLSRAANIFYFKLNGTVVEFYVVPDHTQTGIMGIDYEDAYHYATIDGSPGSTSSYTGNFSSGFTGKKIASISGDPQVSGSVLAGLTASITYTHLAGTGTRDASISGYTILASGATAAPHATTLNALAPMADASAANLNYVDNDTIDKIVFKVQATDYVEKTVATFVSRTQAIAHSTSNV